MINVQEKNVCQQNEWLTKFSTVDAYRSISEHYDTFIASYHDMTLLRAALHHTVYEVSRKFTEEYRILDIVPYYYIQFLLKSKPKTILDLGCGFNIFKPYIPGIIGIDPDPDSPADIHDFFDGEFSQGHHQRYDAVITINAIHFSPVDTITQRIKYVADMIKPGGSAFIAFNLETWLMYTDKNTIRNLFGKIPKFQEVVNYINDQILATGFEFVVVDWPAIHYSEHSTVRDDLNGNIRLVFTK